MRFSAIALVSWVSCVELFGSVVTMGVAPRLLVVDVDAGVDDAWALLALLRAQRLGLVRILAVVAAEGNTDINNVSKNTCRLLQMAHAHDIPVYRGVEKKEDDQKSFPGFFGKDGFGDLEWDWQPDMSQVKPTSGPEALARLTRENPGEISLVGLAPLTNIAEAMKLYPDIASNLKEILIMGGNDPGKNEKSAEFNFLTDPTSANAVITQAKVPITILPVEPCINIDLDLPWRWGAFKDTANPVIQLFNEIERKCWTNLPDQKTWWECDLFLACGMINPAVFRTNITTNARVETTGPRVGFIVADDAQPHNVTIVTKIDSDILMQEVLQSAEIIQPAPASSSSDSISLSSLLGRGRSNFLLIPISLISWFFRTYQFFSLIV